MLDRELERAQLDRVLTAARNGLSGVLVVRGDPGIGKTALLDYAVRASADLRVVHVVGIESEIELGFAALHQVLLPFTSRLGCLPVPQGKALGAAFGLHDGGPPDRLLVGLATLSLLAAVAEEQPLVCVIDDAQWLDQESLAVLAFVARRLQADRIAMIFAVRDLSERPVVLEGLAELQLQGLPAMAARELLSSAAASVVDDQVGSRIIAQTAANPLALIELASELTAGQLAGHIPTPQPLPVGRQLEDSFLRQVRSLSTDIQMVLLLAAADPTGDVDLLWRASRQLDLSLEEAGEAEQKGLIVLGPPVEFRHPLIRSAIYHGASQPNRRLAHAALAEVTDPDLDADRRAWHRAAATVQRSELVARELEDAAERARRRGGYAAAGAFLARSAALTPEARPRVRRLLAAARAECTAGELTRAQSLLESANVEIDSPSERGMAQRVEGDIRVALDQPAAGAAILLASAGEFAVDDIRVARDILLEALLATGTSSRFSAGGADPGDVARAVRTISLPPSESSNAGDLLLDAYAAYVLDGPIVASELMRAALVALDQVQDGAGSSNLLNWLLVAWPMAGALADDRASFSIADRAVRHARAEGAVVPLSMALVLLGAVRILEGDFGSAREAFCERSAIEVARGDFCGTGHLVLAAWRGDEGAVRSLAPVLVEDAQRQGHGWKASWVEYGLCILELGLGHYREALAAVTNAYEENRALAAVAWPDLVEAAVRCDRMGFAHELLEQHAPTALGAASPLGSGLLARSLALVASGSDAEPLYQQSIEQLSTCRGPSHVARTRLVYGEWLRRSKRMRDARSQLETAYELFDGIGAQAFAERAGRELTATGAATRGRAVGSGIRLTPQEGHVASLAARGSTNVEIGAQLFISPNTVDYHLRKVFQKLGVSSRRQLPKLPLPEGLGPEFS